MGRSATAMGRTGCRRLGRSGYRAVVRGRPANEWVEPAPAQEWVTEPAPADVWTEPAPATTSGPESWGEPIAMGYISGSDGDGAVCRAGADAAPIDSRSWVKVRPSKSAVKRSANGSRSTAPASAAMSTRHSSPGSRARLRRARAAQPRQNGGNDGNQAAAPATTAPPVPAAARSPASRSSTWGIRMPMPVKDPTPSIARIHQVRDPEHARHGYYPRHVHADRHGSVGGHERAAAGRSRLLCQHVPAGTIPCRHLHRGGQFVHAENESTGVIVSDLNSDYYGSRWAGGTRLA